MENINVSMDNLDSLLDKFFAGETTCAQEKALEDFSQWSGYSVGI